MLLGLHLGLRFLRHLLQFQKIPVLLCLWPYHHRQFLSQILPYRFLHLLRLLRCLLRLEFPHLLRYRLLLLTLRFPYWCRLHPFQ